MHPNHLFHGWVFEARLIFSRVERNSHLKHGESEHGNNEHGDEEK